MSFSEFVVRLVDPSQLLTHLPYALLVISMMMNDMGWLRVIAIGAALIRIVNRAFINVDPVIVFWEVLFVAVNVVQLLILLYYARRHRFADHEQRFAAMMPAGVGRHTIRKLLRLASLRQFEPDEHLTEEGQAVSRLMFITDGVAQIEKQGRIVAVCGPGDFLGEISFVTGAPASATVVVARPMQCLVFDQARLRAASRGDGDLRRALDAGVNANLAGKLTRTNIEGE